MSGDAQDSCVCCLNCSSSVTVAFEQFSFPAAAAAPAAGNPTAGKKLLEKHSECVSSQAVLSLLCSHSF